ncbi:DNA- binding [Mactra antiquata]
MDHISDVESFPETWGAARIPTTIVAGQVEHRDYCTTTQLPGATKMASPTKLLPVSSPTRSSSSADLSPLSSASSSLSCTRSLPIHCIIEQTSGSTSFDTQLDESSPHNNVELDSYAILPGTTLLSECVRAALLKLGYNATEVIGAKGAIQLKNWKPLCFDSITDSKSATIEDILGELTQVATLRIRICSASKITSAEDVKEKLLQLLLSQSQTLLVNTGCPLTDKGSPKNGHSLATISPEMRRAFDRWYEEQLKSYTEGNGSGPDNLNFAAAAKDLLQMQQERLKASMSLSLHESGTHSDKMPSSSSGSQLGQVSPSASRPTASSTPNESFSHPAYQHYLPGKTRMRTSFDPEHEIPRLQRWFSDNQHPSREVMLQYLQELNSLDSRKGRRPLDLTNIIYWFKNARAAHRRATKNSGDDSFDMEDDKDNMPSLSENYPFLPNRNAVYMVPYPHFPNLDIKSQTGLLNTQSKSTDSHLDDREPCDLSMNSRSRSPSDEGLCLTKSSKSDTESCKRQSPDRETFDLVKVKVEKENLHMSPSRSDEGYSEMGERSPTKGQSTQDNETSVPNSEETDDENINSDLPKDLTMDKQKVQESSAVNESDIGVIKNRAKDLSVSSPHDMAENYRLEKPKDLSNGKRARESDDDDMESDYDDDRSLDGSLSSHDDKMTNLRESYLNSARGLNLGGVIGSPSGQPLHIPQFPHPLAMHYFPLNTHFYSQQANQMKFHNQHSSQQTTPKSSPGQGQENNNSHRKRRTRVFIDPLSEIPKLEKWFIDDTHPSSYMIDKYCEELNSSEYRQKFPKLEPKNVQLWFKNHRAKVKRMRIGGFGDHQIFS